MQPRHSGTTEMQLKLSIPSAPVLLCDNLKHYANLTKSGLQLYILTKTNFKVHLLYYLKIINTNGTNV